MTVRPTAVAHPAATRLLCTEQTVARPRIDTLYGKQILGRQRAVVRRSGQVTDIEWTMVNDAGLPLDLTACGAADASSQSSSQGSSVTAVTEPTIQLRIRDSLNPGNVDGRKSTWCIEGSVVEASTGRVTARYDVSVGGVGPVAPGIYWAEFALLNRDSELIFSNTFKLMLERSLFGSDCNQGPPSLADIRLYMRDSDPVESMLLDSYEFSDAEIIAAIERPIMYWNAQPPNLPPYMTTRNFPFQFRYFWIKATAGELLKTACFHFARNNLEYQAGGLSVNDLNRLPMYQQKAQLYWQEYTDWVRLKKAEINNARCWGGVRSLYGWWG